MAVNLYKLYLNDALKKYVGSISVNENVDNIGVFNATLKTPEYLNATGFESVSIHRDDVEIFGGRLESPSTPFSQSGTSMPIRGFDHTRRLRDYLTPSQSIVDSSTEDALTAILSDTDFATSLVGDFGYLNQVRNWDTTFEMLTQIESFTDTCLRFNVADQDLLVEYDTAITIADFGAWGCHNAFWCEGDAGGTKRYYIFHRDDSDNIHYYHSEDGAYWDGPNDTGFDSNSEFWGIAWRDSKVYAFNEDAGNNVDFWRGPIDADGVIGFAKEEDDIDAGTIIQGPIWDDEGHIWIVVDDGAEGAAWESTDDGANWTQLFGSAGVTLPANHRLLAVAPMGSGGDMMAIVSDDGSNDTDEWLWDKSAGTLTKQNEVASTTFVGVQVGQSSSYTFLLSTKGSGNAAWYSLKILSNWWGSFAFNDYVYYASMYVALSGDAYFIYNCTPGGYWYGGSAIVNMYVYSSGSWRWNVTSDPWYTPDLPVFTSGRWDTDQNGFFYGGTDPVYDGWFGLPALKGIVLNDDSSTGSFLTDTATADASIESWGLLTGDGIQTADGQSVLFDILKAADDSDLLTDLVITADLDEAGLSVLETAVKVQGHLEDFGTAPMVSAVEISEKMDEVSLATDYEDCYTGVAKLADLAGAEFYVTFDGATYTVVFTERRGEDKSDKIILKCSTTADEPDTLPNIEVLNVSYDWSSYANAVRVIGGTVDGVRLEAVVRDAQAIEDFGREVWASIGDGDITNASAARQKAHLELTKRKNVVIRIQGKFVDKYPTGDIQIGDSVTLIGEWADDPDLKISGSHRIVSLTRKSGVGGEEVSASFSNQMKVAQYWGYMSKTEKNERLILS